MADADLEAIDVKEEKLHQPKHRSGFLYQWTSGVWRYRVARMEMVKPLPRLCATSSTSKRTRTKFEFRQAADVALLAYTSRGFVLVEGDQA